jgi:hypothetical protein
VPDHALPPRGRNQKAEGGGISEDRPIRCLAEADFTRMQAAVNQRRPMTGQKLVWTEVYTIGYNPRTLRAPSLFGNSKLRNLRPCLWTALTVRVTRAVRHECSRCPDPRRGNRGIGRIGGRSRVRRGFISPAFPRRRCAKPRGGLLRTYGVFSRN